MCKEYNRLLSSLISVSKQFNVPEVTEDISVAIQEDHKKPEFLDSLCACREHRSKCECCKKDWDEWSDFINRNNR